MWQKRMHFSKGLMFTPDFNEIVMRGPGWGVIVPQESLITSEDYQSHYDEGYRRTQDGGWVPSKLRGHKKVREKAH